MSANESGTWKKVRAWLGQPATRPEPAKTAELLQIEPLEPRLALAVAPIPISFSTSTTGVDIYSAQAGSELTAIWAASRNYREPTSPTAPVDVTTAQGGFSIDDVTVNENDGTATFTVSRTTNPNRTATIDFATADGTAIAGSDYVAQSGTLNFAVGQTSATITVALIDYDASEATETFDVNLSNAIETSGVVPPTTLRILDGTGVGTILDTDLAPDFTISDATVNEGTATVTFTITRGTNSSGTVSVDYATVDGTATAGADYEPASGTLTFADGVTSQTVTINITDDSLYEGDETFTLQLSNAQNLDGGSVTISDADGLGTIVDDDGVPTMTVTSPTVDENAGTLTFDITLSNGAGFDITYDYALVDGTATGGSDYTSASGSRTITAGATTDTIVVPITDDMLVEGTEDFQLQITNVIINSSPTVAITDVTGTGTINDNDSQIDIADTTLDEDAGNMIFTLTRTGGTIATTTVTYTVSGVTATAGTDFTVPSTLTVTFNPGDTTATISVPITADTRYENDETLQVTLTSATNSPQGTATIGTATATGTITNDDAPPDISINDVRLSESAGTFTFTVSLSAISDVAVTFDYATADNLATAPADYNLTSGSGTIAAGSTSTTITVTILDDTVVETVDDTFFVNLSNVVDANVADGQGLGSIVDNDASVSIVATSSATEGAGVTMSFDVTRTAHPDVVTTVNYEVVEAGSGTNFATSALDFTPNTGALTFNAGVTTQTIVVSILDDTEPYEGDEAFQVNLTSASNSLGGTATIASGTSIGTIIDDEVQPNITIDDVQVSESDLILTFTVTLNGTAASDVTLFYASAGVTATSGFDFGAVAGFLTFTAGLTDQTQTVSVVIVNDTFVENNETFELNLFNISGGQAIITDSQGIGTILNNDHVITVNSVTQNEGNSGTSSMTFTLTRTGAANEAVSVQVRTSDGTAVAAGTNSSGGDDFDGTGGVFTTITFAASSSTLTYTATIKGDTVYESNEFFFLDLQNPGTNSGTITVGASGVGTITNDDSIPAITIGDTTVTEDGSSAVFPITLSNASDSTIVVLVSTADGTATFAGGDYIQTISLVTFAAGSTSETFSVPVVDEHTTTYGGFGIPTETQGSLENSETFLLNGSLFFGTATFADSQGQATVSEPTFTRPSDGGGSLSGTTTRYDAFSLTLPTFLTFDYQVTLDGTGDPFLAVYSGSFDPSSPLTNLVAADDDITTGTDLRSRVTLSPGTYIFVVTTFSSNSSLLDWTLDYQLT